MSTCEGCGGEHSQEEFDSLTGGPSDDVLSEAVDVFRAMATMRVGQVSDPSDDDLSHEVMHAATEPLHEITTVIMFLRHSVKQAEREGYLEDRDEMAAMLWAVEVVTALASMGPVLFADEIMHSYEREFTPRGKFSDRWANEMPTHIPPFDPKP